MLHLHQRAQSSKHHIHIVALKRELNTFCSGHSNFDNPAVSYLRKKVYTQNKFSNKYKTSRVQASATIRNNMSTQANDTLLDFIRSSDSSDAIKFEVVEKQQQGDKIVTKLTAQFHFGKFYGNETFFATYWKPGDGEYIAKDSIKALVFIAHGYAEYLGDAYDEVAKLWAHSVGGGCLVFGHDHVGHGRTTAGDRVLVGGMHEFVDPIIAHIQAVQNWTNCGDGKLPVFLVGHSMGGLISLHTLFKKQNIFAVRQMQSKRRFYY